MIMKCLTACYLLCWRRSHSKFWTSQNYLPIRDAKHSPTLAWELQTFYCYCIKLLQVLYKSRDPSWCFPMPEVRVIILMAAQLRGNGCLIRKQIQIHHDNEVSHSMLPAVLEEISLRILDFFCSKPPQRFCFFALTDINHLSHFSKPPSNP